MYDSKISKTTNIGPNTNQKRLLIRAIELDTNVNGKNSTTGTCAVELRIYSKNLSARATKFTSVQQKMTLHTIAGTHVDSIDGIKMSLKAHNKSFLCRHLAAQTNFRNGK